MLYSEFYYLEINFNSLTELNLVFCFCVLYVCIYTSTTDLNYIWKPSYNIGFHFSWTSVGQMQRSC